jgi:hypothetical protein
MLKQRIQSMVVLDISVRLEVCFPVKTKPRC